MSDGLLGLNASATIEVGALPVTIVVGGLNVPSPLPRKMLTVLAAILTTARSAKPSLLKSPTAIDVGLEPLGRTSGEDGAAVKVPSPFPSRIETVLSS